MARKPSSGPASDPELLILSSLADGPKHGWAIMGDIETFAGVTIGPGTLYNAITRLVEKELIAPLEDGARLHDSADGGVELAADFDHDRDEHDDRRLGGNRG